GDYVFGTDDEQLEHVIVRELIKRSKTFATLESGSSGLMAQWIAHVEDAVACYRGGLVRPVLVEQAEMEARSLLDEIASDFVVFVGEQAVETDSTGQLVITMPVGW